MQYKAVLLPRQGEKVEQVFCADLEQARSWARRILWDKHRKICQNLGPGMADRDPPYDGPRVRITETKVVEVGNVFPWEVTDEDKKQDPTDGN